MTLDTKRAQLLERATSIFGDVATKKVQEISGTLVMTADIDHIEYTDEMLHRLLNNVVYDKEQENLFAKYVVPPFSVLDTRQGYWRERNKRWLQITGDLTATKEQVLGEGLLAKINNGSSNFDPVLAELMYTWFNVPGGKILDPFGGEQTKGVVAGVMGYPYWGCELRQDQVDLNSSICSQWPHVHYACGDSTELDSHIMERAFDFMLTSPPYYDLEIYSTDEADLSAALSYEDFMRGMATIYRKTYELLNENRFAVIKVGEVRDQKTGVYRNYVADSIKAMTDAGYSYYNELILVNNVGTAPVRASGAFRTRKMVKLHQNVLVFYKGDTRTIAQHFGQAIPHAFEDNGTPQAALW